MSESTIGIGAYVQHLSDPVQREVLRKSAIEGFWYVDGISFQVPESALTLIRKANPSPQLKTECGEAKMPESKSEILNRHIKDVVEYLHSNLRTAVLAAMEEYATQQREGLTKEDVLDFIQHLFESDLIHLKPYESNFVIMDKDSRMDLLNEWINIPEANPSNKDAGDLKTPNHI